MSVNAVIIQSKGRITNPLPGTPNLPSISAGILFDWDPETLNIPAGAAVTSVRSKRGSLGRAGDLSVITAGTVALTTEENGKKSLILGNGSLATEYFPKPLTAPLTVAVVARALDPSHSGRYVFSGGAGGYASMTFRGIGFGAANQVEFGATAPVQSYASLVGVFAGADSKTQINGGNEKTGTTGGNSAAQAPRFILGSNSSAAAASNLVGRVQRVIAYDRVLTEQELGMLNSYLSAEYGL